MKQVHEFMGEWSPEKLDRVHLWISANFGKRDLRWGFIFGNVLWMDEDVYAAFLERWE